MNSRTNPRKIDCETFEVRFEGFEGLPARNGQDSTKSGEFMCFGHQWTIKVYPGGEDRSDDGMVALYLCHESADERIDVCGCINVRGFFWRGTRLICFSESYNFLSGTRRFEPKGINDTHNGNGRLCNCWGTNRFAKRSELIDSLQAGALVVEVQMRRKDPANAQSQLFIPQNPLVKNVLKKFMDEESADVVFEVCSEKAGKGGKKRAKTAPKTTFYAHRFILEECSPLFSELCRSNEDLTPISINDIKPEIFRIMLYHAYGGKVADDDLEAKATDIIDSADKFGMTSLKLEAEVSYVRSTELTIENVMDNLEYADAMNCPLLKEAAIDFAAKNGGKVAKEVSQKGIHISREIFADFLVAMEREKKGGLGAKCDGDFSLMCVDDLRRKLDEKGLDVDGSREAMIAALKENP